MIKSSDVRLGNCIYYKEKAVTVRPNDIGLLYEYERFGRTDVPFSPVPLSPAILEKAGFTNWGENYHMEGAVDYCKMTWDEENKEWDFYYAPMKSRTGQDICSIKYVHQLQNIHFALTGEELEINFTDND